VSAKNAIPIHSHDRVFALWLCPIPQGILTTGLRLLKGKEKISRILFREYIFVKIT